MLEAATLKDYFLLIATFVFTVMLPGCALTRFILPPIQLKKMLAVLPRPEGILVDRYFYWLFAPAIGLIMVDAVVLLLAKFNLALNYTNYLVSFILINVVLVSLNILLVKPTKAKPENMDNNLKAYALIFIAIWLGSVLIRTVFYLPNVVPQETDLGHHMYWSEFIVQKEVYPVYDTPEVIEGEHMIFAVLSKLSGISLLSAMPLIILSFYNLAMLLGLYFGSIVITADRKIALWALFFSGVYFAVDPPQARYVKGGVIGNTLGNLFIPLVFLLFFMFFRYFCKYLNQKLDESKIDLYRPVISLISLVMVVVGGSFYTHHLSTLLLGITLAASFVFWIAITLIWNKLQKISITDTIKLLSGFFSKILLSPKLIISLLMVVSFPIFVYLPHYLGNKAIETVTQEPEKDTHLGITLDDFIGKMGWTRFVLLVIALVYLLVQLIAQITGKHKVIEKISLLKFIKHLKMNLGSSSMIFLLLILGWFLPLALLSFSPEIFKIDLPSRRVVNYLVFPAIILVAIMASLLFSSIAKKINGKIFKWVIVVLAVAVLWDGTSDFRSVYSGKNKFQDAVQLYNASDYLAKHTNADAVMLKDHRTISGDTWIKFFLLRGYDDFLSRTYDYKYNDVGNDLDPCTREMIIVPESKVSSNCYGQTGINYVIVKPSGDEFLFWKGEGFNEVYVSNDIAIFKVDGVK